MLFKDRFDAALKLLPCLKHYKDTNGVIFAVPGGGVPIGYYLAKNNDFPMELLLSKKINHPKNDSIIGAVNMNDHVIDKHSTAPLTYVKKEIDRIRKNLQERHQKFMEGRKSIDARGKTVFIVDDGVATGNTLLSAIRILRDTKPRKIVVVVPVAPIETIKRLKAEVDDFICLRTLDSVVKVGLNYLNYSQVSDKEISQLLNGANRSEYYA